MKKHHPINLSSYNDFKKHKWLTPLYSKYDKDSLLANYAISHLITDLESFNQEYVQKHNRVLFTTIEGRVKTKDSFFNKLYEICCENTKNKGVSPLNLEKFYNKVQDLAGIRFSCPYYDEVEPIINKLIRPKLRTYGYATDLDEDCYNDRNYLDQGDNFGYRSYHFFTRIPTITDIYGNVELFLCEVQGRSELQHVWAVKSHDLLYKPKSGWILECSSSSSNNNNIIEDMKQLGNNLRAADQFLISIRDRVKGEK